MSNLFTVVSVEQQEITTGGYGDTVTSVNSNSALVATVGFKNKVNVAQSIYSTTGIIRNGFPYYYF